jgi:DNA polymerase-3 subunit epsilon
MLDVETSGLNPNENRLLAIAAIALRVDWTRRHICIDPGDSFEVFVQQRELTREKDNILLHGIGVQRQQEGLAPHIALKAFEAYAGASPLLAFHAAFDQAVIERHMRQHLNRIMPNPWVDVEKLCAVTHEKVRARALDEWMEYFAITCAARHQAAADALAECEVLLRIWPRIAAQCKSWKDIERLAQTERWIQRA